MRVQRFWLPIKFPGLNEYTQANRSNAHIGNDMKTEYTNAVALVVKRDGFRVKYPVTIDFVWQEENAKRDPDNIIFAKKFILDGLVVAGILPNDTQQWVYGFTETWLARPPKNSKVSISPNLEVGVWVTVKEVV